MTKNTDLYQSNSIMRNNVDDTIDIKSSDFGYDNRHYNSEFKRNKSSRHGSLRNQNGYPKTQMRGSPEKFKNHMISDAKANVVARGKFSTHYSTKGRRKSNQYLPDLRPNQQMMSNTNSITSNGFASSSMMESTNIHLRSMSKDHNKMFDKNYTSSKRFDLGKGSTYDKALTHYEKCGYNNYY